MKDSLSLWIDASKVKIYSKKKRIKYLEKSFAYLINNIDDTLINRSLGKISYSYLKLKDTFNFKKINNFAFRIADVKKDTFLLADTYWNMANYYRSLGIYDSSYYHYNKAFVLFEKINNEYYAAKMLYGMAFIKGRFKDYRGSEVLTIKAISKYKLLKKYKSLYASYNHLALLQKGLGNYDKSLFYHDKSLEYYQKLKNKKYFYETSLNNIGLVYHSKKDYKKAVYYFSKAINNNNLKKNNLNLYTKLIDNRAYSKMFINENKKAIELDFLKSLAIRDSLNCESGILINKLHLAEYYQSVFDTIKALKYAKESKLLAQRIKNSRDYLESLKILSKLDNGKVNNYLNKYIKFNDSLMLVERKVQNKFTRIAFETDEYIEETKRLSQQRIWFVVTGLGSLSILLLLFVIKNQKAKNNKLYLETMQRSANEKIYLLTLKQQTKFEEERIKERNRISEELHDNILSKLFGTRLGLGFLDIKGDKKIILKHQSFLNELQTIEKEIRDVSHKLNLNFDKLQISFISIVEKLLKSKSKIANLKYTIETDEKIHWKDISEDVKVNLYRIFQEIIQNVIKHSKAKNIALKFTVKENKMTISFSDDGIGFKYKKNKKGIGFKNMQSRIKKINGTFNLYSKKGLGTKIQICIPIK
jgi:signal transduction histidine kinase